MSLLRHIILSGYFFLINSFFISAFSTSIDSLEKKLNTDIDKKERLILLNCLAKEYASLSFENSLKYGNQAYELARKLKDTKQEVDALLNIGEVYSLQNNSTKTSEYLNKAIDLSKKTGYNDGVVISLNSLGLNYYYQGKYDDALKNYQSALLYSKQNKIVNGEGNALYNIGNIYKKKNNYEKAETYYMMALKVFESTNDNNGLAKINNILGIIQFEKGNYNDAVNYYEKALKYRQMSGDKRGSAILYNNIGNVLLNWGKYDKAVNYYQNALKLFEEIGLQEGVARCLNSLGLVYENLNRNEKYEQNIVYHKQALDYHEKSLKIWETLGNTFEIANLYNNIGNVYAKQTNEKLSSKYGANWSKWLPKKESYLVTKEFYPAIQYYRKALTLREKIGDKRGLALTLYNLGRSTYVNYNEALSYLQRALKLHKEMDDKYEVSHTLSDIGTVYYNIDNFSKALDYLYRSLDISIKEKYSGLTKDAYKNLSDVYFASGDYKMSLATYKKCVEIQDSLFNENKSKQIAEIQTQYETEKKVQQIELLSKDAKLKDVQIKQKNTQIYFVGSGMLLVLVITVLLIKQNKERKKVNNELAAKNEVITEQQKEIKDSIHYASRIQRAVMYFESQLKQFMPESFIYFQPRDIVSGDFYWIYEKNGKIIVAAADCTGHGVPGAFMSMLGMAMLNTIVVEFNEVHSNEILDDLRRRIIESLHQTGREGENKDGMDIALYIFDPAAMNLEYSGANNSLYVVRNGELFETKADRMPIGIYEKAATPFSKNIIPLQKGDMIYTFSDGYHDQFGGPNNKKFMSGNLKKLFAEISKEPMDKQYNIVHATITEWMKDTYQIDDMLIIGARV